MKKIILGAALASSCLLAEVVTLLPYGGMIDYGSDSSKSFKDKATIFGAHVTVGDLSYLIEADYAHIDTKYKDSNIENLKQDDMSLVYGGYYTNFMYRIGAHYISTNDDQLKDGIVAIASLGGYNYFDYDKLSYGLEGYYSHYDKGHNENYTEKSIAIIQVTPYLSYYKSINVNWGNTLSLKMNYQLAGDYIQDTYSSYEISDTIFYKSFFTTLQVYTGEARTLVQDSGMTVFNTLDLMKNGYKVQLGYYITKDALISASYGMNEYREFDQTFSTITQDNINSIALVSLSYSF